MKRLVLLDIDISNWQPVKYVQGSKLTMITKLIIEILRELKFILFYETLGAFNQNNFCL